MITYYVLKYGDRYYAPYQNMQSFTIGAYYLNQVLTPHRALAIRFGDLEIANFIRKEELRAQSWNPDFDPKKCRVVKVTSKETDKTVN